MRGRKFSSGGALLAHPVPIAATDDQNRNVPGLTIVDDWSSFGQRTMASGTTLFENVRLPAEHAVPHQRAFDRPTAMGPLAQIIHAAVDAGIARAAIAEAMLARAGRIVDRAPAEQGDETVAAASVAVAEAKILTTEIVMLAANKLFELSGTRSTSAEHDLDRHWRNARTHTLHDPVRWKHHTIGNFDMNGVQPPRYGAIWKGAGIWRSRSG